MFVELPHSNLDMLATLEWGSCTKIWLVPVAVTTVLFTPDDGCGRHRKHVEFYCSKIKYRLRIVAFRWTFTNIYDFIFIYCKCNKTNISQSSEKVKILRNSCKFVKYLEDKIFHEKWTLQLHDNFTLELVVNRTDFNNTTVAIEELVWKATTVSLSKCSSKNQHS
jgi:hypothetical protein